MHEYMYMCVHVHMAHNLYLWSKICSEEWEKLKMSEYLKNCIQASWKDKKAFFLQWLKLQIEIHLKFALVNFPLTSNT